MSMIFIACGGTGGHLFPGIALAEEFRKRNHDVRLYISRKPVDAEAVKPYSQFEFATLPAIGWTGANLGAIRFGFQYLRSILISQGDIKKYSPSAVIGMGGFLSAAPLQVAASKKIPAFLHESNSIPGRVTRWLAPKLTRVFVGFEECSKHLPKDRSIFTGTPVRKNLIKLSRDEAAKILGVSANFKTLLIMGGSQGARDLNTLVGDVVPLLNLDWKQWQVVHLTGPRDVERVSAIYEKNKVTAKVLAFCDKMEAVYSISDLVVSRSGAASLTEIMHYGLPSILVPYPYAADDHQSKNATILVSKGAARRLSETEPALKSLARELHSLMRNDQSRATIAKTVSSIYIQNPAERIVQEVEHAIA